MYLCLTVNEEGDVQITKPSKNQLGHPCKLISLSHKLLPVFFLKNWHYEQVKKHKLKSFKKEFCEHSSHYVLCIA